MWGRISDRHGRRPVLLTGLIGNSLSSCLFGLSKNLWWAIGSRALCGIMNGNSGVARSLVSEITDNTNKAKAFAIFGFCWGAGMIGNVYFKRGGGEASVKFIQKCYINQSFLMHLELKYTIYD
jgi:MFS family permease